MKKEISYLETLKAIDECKKHFESQLEKAKCTDRLEYPYHQKY